MAKKKKEESPNFFKRILVSYRKIPEKKPYIEFITALLTIPVLLTVILINYNNLNGEKKDNNPISPEKIFVYPTKDASDSQNPNPTSETETVVVTNEACKKQLGPVSITSPQEGETVTESPASVNVSYDSNTYCGAVWAYRINNGKWSDYDDKSIALYTLPQGNIKLELKVKSLASSDEKTITRNFVYKGSSSDGPTPTIASN